MNSFRAPFWFVTVLFIAAMAFIVVQYNTIQQLTKEIAALGPESGKAKQLRAENAALLADLQRIEERTDAEHRELLRLRGQASTMRDKEAEIARLKAERERLAQQIQTPPPAPPAPPAPPDTQERRRTIARLSFSRQVGLALIMAASDNQEQLPPNLEALDGKYLQRTPEMDDHNIQIGQFEMLYKGRTVGAPDPSRTVLAREKQPMQRTDGKWEQVYVFVDGHAEVLSGSSPEQLAQREKEQFILPKNP